MTAHGTIPDAVQAAQQGVFGFLTAPLKRAAAGNHRQCPAEHPATRRRWQQKNSSPPIARCSSCYSRPRWRRRVTSVFYTGRKWHRQRGFGPRHPQGQQPGRQTALLPSTVAHCRATFESELFGHQRFFTGAIRNYPGLFRAADGGTLFLDEIGTCPRSPSGQTLRALQEKTIRPPPVRFRMCMLMSESFQQPTRISKKA